jgi:hypothetical protein
MPAIHAKGPNATTRIPFVAWESRQPLIRLLARDFRDRPHAHPTLPIVSPAKLCPTLQDREHMAARQRYYISIENLTKARGEFNELSFHGTSPDSFASLLQEALREPTLWRRWRDMQPDPDAIDPGLGVNDPDATVSAHQSDLHVDVEVATSLPHAILRHRLELLIGHNWKLRDVRAA